jgi:hypothetical protein
MQLTVALSQHVWHPSCSIFERLPEVQKFNARSEWTMAIEKKSLINTLKTTKKANIVKGEAATTSPAVMSPNVKHPNVKHPNVKHPNVKHPNVKHPNVKHPVVKM